MVTILKTEVFPHFIFCVLSTHIVFQDKDYEHLIKILTFYAEFLDILHSKHALTDRHNDLTRCWQMTTNFASPSCEVKCGAQIKRYGVARYPGVLFLLSFSFEARTIKAHIKFKEC